MGKIPERWLTYQGVNKPLENLPIVSFKTPLSEKYHRPKSYTSNDEVFVESDEQFTPSQLYDKLLDDGYTLDTVVDLTFTYRYYDGALFARGYDLHYEKIMCAGQQLPNEDVVYKVADVINEFIHENGKDTTKLLGIHCTHGVNRTGYIVCRYLIEWLGYEPEVAIKAFNKSRGHDIERTVYLEDLRRRTPKNYFEDAQNEMPSVFEIHGTHHKIEKLWREWRVIFEKYLTNKKISDHKKKYRLLFQFAGKDVLHYVQAWCDTTDNYESLLTSLENSFRSKVNIRFERHLFQACVPHKDDKIERYIDRLRILAKTCSFENETDRIVDQVIEKYASDSLRHILLREHELGLKELIDISRTDKTLSVKRPAVNYHSKSRKYNSRTKYKEKANF